jgi:folate-binding protein YgfZ
MATRFGDLSSTTKLRVVGADRVRFLNGQTTNDVRQANAESTQESCVLNTKGQLDAHLFLFATTDAIWINADDDLREQLRARLERYLVADDVVIDDVTDDFALFHFFSIVPPEIVGAEFCLKSHRLTNNGWDVWFRTKEKEKVLTSLCAVYEPIGISEWEVLRVEDGIPQWGRELTPKVIPPEANLQERAIDYEKGCYIGQEVISRMKMSGQARQRLCGVISEQKEELASGMSLAAGERVVGQITSAVFSERLKAPIALALIKRGFNEPGTKLAAAADGRKINVNVVPLPFLAAEKI